MVFLPADKVLSDYEFLMGLKICYKNSGKVVIDLTKQFVDLLHTLFVRDTIKLW